MDTVVLGFRGMTSGFVTVRLPIVRGISLILAIELDRLAAFSMMTFSAPISADASLSSVLLDIEDVFVSFEGVVNADAPVDVITEPSVGGGTLLPNFFGPPTLSFLPKSTLPTCESRLLLSVENDE